MFVPVSCTSCGKPFQVPEAALGKLAPCPWCGATVTALPVSAPTPQSEAPSQSQTSGQTKAQAPPAKPRATAAPLSLDDESKSAAAVPVSPPARRLKINPTTVLIGAAVFLLVAAATMIVRGYGSGKMSEVGWINFTPPDGSFTMAMPGQPTEEDVPANPEGSVLGGKRYSVRGWYSKAGVWVAYTDLNPALLPKLKSDTDKIVAAGVLRVERDREVTRLKGKVAKEVERRLNKGWGVELHIDTPSGNAIAWLILMYEGPHPRLYSFGVEGKDLAPTTPAVAKVFGSFQVSD